MPTDETDRLSRARFAQRAEERTIISVADLRRPTVRWGLRILIVVVIALLVMISAGPLLWLAKAAVSTTTDINADPFGFWPSGIQWHNLADAWTTLRIGQATLNTIVLAAGEVLFGFIVQFTGGYVLAILRPRYGSVLNGLIMATLFVPSVLSLVPLFLTVTDLHLNDSYWAVWLPKAVSAFNILIFKQAFQAIPREIFEAARVDGVGNLRMLWSILVPMSRPIIGVVVLLTFINSWKDFLWPLLVLPSADKQPLSVALNTSSTTADEAVLLAGMFVTVIIPIVVFLVFQRQFLRGAGSAGAIKG